MLPVLPSFLLGNTHSAAAQQASSGLSFVVYGDSRPMMYLPVKEGRPDLVELFVEMFGLVMPEKVAEAVVKRDVKMIFDPVTKELNYRRHAVHVADRGHDVDRGPGLGYPRDC